MLSEIEAAASWRAVSLTASSPGFVLEATAEPAAAPGGAAGTETGTRCTTPGSVMSPSPIY